MALDDVAPPPDPPIEYVRVDEEDVPDTVPVETDDGDSPPAFVPLPI